MSTSHLFCPGQAVQVAADLVSLSPDEVKHLALSYAAVVALLDDARADLDDAKEAVASARATLLAWAAKK